MPRTSKMKLLAGLGLVFGAASCGPTAPPPARYVLSDGTVVAVRASGAFTLTTGTGHALLGTAPGAASFVRMYGQTV